MTNMHCSLRAFSRRGGGDEYETITRRMVEHQPAFVANTGDMIGAANKEQWAYFREKSKAVTVPYFLTVGNHDAYDEESETLYKKEVLGTNCTTLLLFPILFS